MSYEERHILNGKTLLYNEYHLGDLYENREVKIFPTEYKGNYYFYSGQFRIIPLLANKDDYILVKYTQLNRNTES